MSSSFTISSVVLLIQIQMLHLHQIISDQSHFHFHFSHLSPLIQPHFSISSSSHISNLTFDADDLQDLFMDCSLRVPIYMQSSNKLHRNRLYLKKIV
ncbi:hypothetical protein Hdeb2414_s0222g00838661 [Helianthus debilis subsp. tardiflorus]